MSDNRCHDAKFVNLERACKAGYPEGVLLIAEPCVLGDTYDELLTSLDCIADAEMHLAIVPKRSRGHDE
jgi:hypothetical protein